MRNEKTKEYNDDDWGDDKTKRSDRYKQKKVKKDKQISRDMPSRVDRIRPRQNRIDWQGDDYDYKEEFGEG